MFMHTILAVTIMISMFSYHPVSNIITIVNQIITKTIDRGLAADCPSRWCRITGVELACMLLPLIFGQLGGSK